MARNRALVFNPEGYQRLAGGQHSATTGCLENTIADPERITAERAAILSGSLLASLVSGGIATLNHRLMAVIPSGY